MNAIHRRYHARQDLVAIFRYLVREAGLAVARRFRVQAEATFTRLAGMPGLSGRYPREYPELANLRFFPISRFRNHVVYYRPVADGIQIVRALHAARDIDGLLSEELGIEDDPENDPGIDTDQ